MSLLGTMVVRIAAEMARYKADINDVAKDTEAAANKIEQSTGRASTAAGKLNGSMGEAVRGAEALHASAGLAGVGVGVLAAGLAAAGYAAYQGAQEDGAYRKSLILTGNAAGTTAGQMADMAKGISQNVGTQYQAAAALAAMAGTGQGAAASLQKFAQTAVEMERTVGQSVGDTAKTFAELGREPVKASLKLNESMNYLTASTFAQIKAADDLGDLSTAASIAQDAYATAMKTRTEQIKGNLGTLETAWMGLKDAAKWAWDSMMGLGRATGPEQALETQRKAVANLETLLANGGTATGDIQRKLDAAKQALGVMQETVRLGERAAQSQADQAASQKAQIAWMQDGDKYLSKAEKMEREIARLRFEGNAAGATELEIEKRIAVEREKGRDKAGRKDNSAARELEKEAALLAQLSGVNADYQQQLTRLQSSRDKGNISEARYVALVTELIGKQPMASKLMAEAAKAADAVAKAQAEVRKQTAQYYDGLAKGIAVQAQSNDKLREQVEEIGLTTEALGALRLARLDVTIAQEEETLAMMSLHEASAGELVMLRERIKLLKEQRSLTATGAAKTIAADEAKSAASEWAKSAEKIESSLTDALMRGFESGKGFLLNLRDTAVNMFKTLVLRPVISGVMSPIAQGVTGALGLSNTASAGTSALGMVNTASNLNTLYGAGSQALLGGTAGASAASLLYANGVGAVGGDALGALIAANGSWAGVSAGAATGAAGAGAGAAGAGISSALAAIPVYGWIALAVLAVAAWATGNGETRNGASYGTGADGKALKLEGPSGGEIAGDTARAMFDATQQSINTTLKLVGSKATVAGFVAGLESSKDGMGFAFAGGKIGDTGFGDYKGRNGGQFGFATRTSEQAMADYVNELRKATLGALQAASDVPAAIADKLRGVDLGESMTAEALTALEASIHNVIAGVQSLNAGLQRLPFADLKDLSFAAGAALVYAAEGLDGLINDNGLAALGELLSGFAENFYSAAEKTALASANLSGDFARLGIVMPEVNASLRDWYRMQVESAMALDQSVPANAAATVGVLSLQAAVNSLSPVLEVAADAVGQLAAAAAEAAKAAAAEAAKAAAGAALDAASTSANAAMAAVQRAVDSQRKIYQAQADAAQGAVSEITGIFDTLKSSIATLYGQVDSAQTAAMGRAFIDNALSNAQKTGYLPDSKELASAVQAAMQDSTVFASQAEADFAKLKLAGSMSQLKDLAGVQLSTAEKQLQAANDQLASLDNILANAQSQLDAALGIDASVLSMTEALDRLNVTLLSMTDAILSALQAGALGPADVAARLRTTTGSALAMDAMSTINTGSGTAQVWASSGGALAMGSGAEQTIFAKDGSRFSGTDAIGFVNDALAKNDGAAVYTAALRTGISAASLDALMGWGAGTSNTWAEENNLPRFAAGGSFAGGLRWVGENGPELEATGPSHIFSAQQSRSMLQGNNNARLESLVEGLTKEVQRLQSIVNDGNTHARRTAETLDNVTEGGANMRTVTA